MRLCKLTLTLLALILLSTSSALAEELYLKNGDRITGEIIEETDNLIKVATEAMGTVTVVKDSVDRRGSQEEKKKEKEKKSPWTRTLSVGYTQAGGNTDKSQGTFDIRAVRKTKENEWTLKGNAYYSSADKKMDAKKFYAMTRYAFSFGEKNKWYNFYKLEGDQDRFANVNYRVIPSAGFGYWFADEDDWKLMTELAVGYEYTEFRDSTKSDGDVILIPRAYIEKVLINDLRITQDITLYPSLADTGEYRLRSETGLINPISDKLSWKISFIDEFNSSPKGTTKKNDYRIISSVDYEF